MTKPELDQKIERLTQEVEGFYSDRVTILDAAIAKEQSTTLITTYESRKRALSRVRGDLLDNLAQLRTLSP